MDSAFFYRDSGAMDMSFPHRARRLLADRTPARLDYGVLVATLDAIQSASAAARAARCARGPADSAPREPLVDILLATPAWSDAVAAQEGRFHRDPSRTR